MNLMELLPPVYEGNATMQELQKLLSDGVNALTDGINDVVNESCVGTASKQLSRYEKIFGIKTDINKSDAFRRERILAKIRGIGTATKTMMEQTARAYSGGEVKIIEHPESNSFVVKFIGTLGIPENMEDLTVTMEEIKPAHLSFTYEYVYNPHSQLARLTHAQLSSRTYYQIRNEVLK
ncbi:uncharacterized protein YmfQ (DUF2313 family) [Anaerotaenia torta]|uniref:putative phage tail protein n=1 Tax=Anaerotaenia torta TaxID=433293 RepID=UPI003D1BAFFB